MDLDEIVSKADSEKRTRIKVSQYEEIGKNKILLTAKNSPEFNFLRDNGWRQWDDNTTTRLILEQNYPGIVYDAVVEPLKKTGDGTGLVEVALKMNGGKRRKSTKRRRRSTKRRRRSIKRRRRSIKRTR